MRVIAWVLSLRLQEEGISWKTCYSDHRQLHQPQHDSWSQSGGDQRSGLHLQPNFLQRPFCQDENWFGKHSLLQRRNTLLCYDCQEKQSSGERCFDLGKSVLRLNSCVKESSTQSIGFLWWWPSFSPLSTGLCRYRDAAAKGKREPRRVDELCKGGCWCVDGLPVAQPGIRSQSLRTARCCHVWFHLNIPSWTRVQGRGAARAQTAHDSCWGQFAGGEISCLAAWWPSQELTHRIPRRRAVSNNTVLLLPRWVWSSRRFSPFFVSLPSPKASERNEASVVCCSRSGRLVRGVRAASSALWTPPGWSATGRPGSTPRSKWWPIGKVSTKCCLRRPQRISARTSIATQLIQTPGLLSAVKTKWENGFDAVVVGRTTGVKNFLGSKFLFARIRVFAQVSKRELSSLYAWSSAPPVRLWGPKISRRNRQNVWTEEPKIWWAPMTMNHVCCCFVALSLPWWH